MENIISSTKNEINETNNICLNPFREPSDIQVYIPLSDIFLYIGYIISCLHSIIRHIVIHKIHYFMFTFHYETYSYT